MNAPGRADTLPEPSTAGDAGVRPWRSLRLRITLLVLATTLLSVWTLTFVGTRLLHQDLEDLVTAQQRAVVTILAEQVNQQVAERRDALVGLAGLLRTADLKQANLLAVFLRDRPALTALFNAGAFVIDDVGQVVASAPADAKRMAQGYASFMPAIAAVPAGGSFVSAPRLSRALGAPAFAIGAPIHSSDGRLLGAVMGVTDLKPGQLPRPLHPGRLCTHGPARAGGAEVGHGGHRH